MKKCARCKKEMSGKYKKSATYICNTCLYEITRTKPLFIKTSTREQLTNPSRYTSKSGKQVFDIIDDFELDFYQGNVIKYVVRYNQKNGIEDLKKAKVYIDKLIELESDDEDCH